MFDKPYLGWYNGSQNTSNVYYYCVFMYLFALKRITHRTKWTGLYDICQLKGSHNGGQVNLSIFHWCALSKVFSWGRNDRGQLGINRISKCEGVPQKVVQLQETCIMRIACGKDHVLALNARGDLFSWGSNEHYQLGLVNVENQSLPSKKDTK